MSDKEGNLCAKRKQIESVMNSPEHWKTVIVLISRSAHTERLIAYLQISGVFSRLTDRPTERPTHRPTEGQTDRYLVKAANLHLIYL